MNYYLCFLWDWFCLFYTSLSFVPLAFLKSNDPWLPIQIHNRRPRMIVLESWFNFPPPTNSCCPCSPFPSLGELTSETEGAGCERTGFPWGCVKVRPAGQVEDPSVPEERPLLRDANPSWQVTCCLWRVDVWLQAWGGRCAALTGWGKGSSGCATCSETDTPSSLHTSNLTFLPPSTSALAFTWMCPRLSCGLFLNLLSSHLKNL